MSGPGTPEAVVLGFGTTHAALAAERLLLDIGVPVTPIPAPKDLGQLCGIALRLDPEDAPRAEEVLANADIPVRARRTVVRA